MRAAEVEILTQNTKTRGICALENGKTRGSTTCLLEFRRRMHPKSSELNVRNLPSRISENVRVAVRTSINRLWENVYGLSSFACTRPDGVVVVPITALRD